MADMCRVIGPTTGVLRGSALRGALRLVGVWALLVAGAWAEAPEIAVGEPVVLAVYATKQAPMVERFGDGTIYVGRRHTAGLGPFGFRSADGGQTWAAASYAGIMVGQPPDGRAMGFEKLTVPIAPGEFVGRVRISTDSWKTVRGPVEIRLRIPNATGGTGDDGIPFGGPLFWRSVVAMPSGELLATMYGYFAGDRAYRSLVVRSHDQGGSWSYLSTVGTDGVAEPTMVRLPDGTLFVVMRTGSMSGPMRASRSHDDGQTWTAPVAAGLAGVDPDMIVLRDGTVAVGYGLKAPGRERRIAFSLDHGNHWVRDVLVWAGPGGTYSGLREVAPHLLVFVYDAQTGPSTFEMRASFIRLRTPGP